MAVIDDRRADVLRNQLAKETAAKIVATMNEKAVVERAGCPPHPYSPLRSGCVRCHYPEDHPVHHA